MRDEQRSFQMHDLAPRFALAGRSRNSRNDFASYLGAAGRVDARVCTSNHKEK
jgi:hypothetical protein